MALDDFDHPSCTCTRTDSPLAGCPLHGIGTAYWEALNLDPDRGRQIRVGPAPKLGESIRLHVDKLILQYREDQEALITLLTEARNHAKLTQNLDLVRRIEAQLKKMEIV